MATKELKSIYIEFKVDKKHCKKLKNLEVKNFLILAN